MAKRVTPDAARWGALASQRVKHLGEFKTARTARDAMAQGTHLLMLKEASPHGSWLNQVKTLGLASSTANHLMAMARRFADAPDAFFEAVGTVSKMAELLPLEDALMLVQGDEVHGLTLERIKSMSVLKLRAAVREACQHAAGSEEERQALLEKELSLTRPKPVHLPVEEERMPEHARQAEYCKRLCKVLTRYANADELPALVDMLEAFKTDILTQRHAPGLNDAAYHLYAVFHLGGKPGVQTSGEAA